jgi:hypothetical protein
LNQEQAAYIGVKFKVHTNQNTTDINIFKYFYAKTTKHMRFFYFKNGKIAINKLAKSE